MEIWIGECYVVRKNGLILGGAFATVEHAKEEADKYEIIYPEDKITVTRLDIFDKD